MRDKITTGCEIVGLLLLSWAAALVAVPLGLAAAGASLLLVGWLAGDR